MKIYTRFGDQGQTHLLGGQTTRKNDLRISLCGTLDELNAVLGIVASYDLPPLLRKSIAQIQADLFSVGATIAAVGADSQMELPSLKASDVQQLETWIDEMSETLDPLVNFLLPGGAMSAANMHLARAVCRRAERILVDLVDHHSDCLCETEIKYLNRLGDWCFVAARFINKSQKVDEPIWNSGL